MSACLFVKKHITGWTDRLRREPLVRGGHEAEVARSAVGGGASHHARLKFNKIEIKILIIIFERPQGAV